MFLIRITDTFVQNILKGLFKNYEDGNSRISIRSCEFRDVELKNYTLQSFYIRITENPTKCDINIPSELRVFKASIVNIDSFERVL